MYCCIRTPLYIACWILLLMNLHRMWHCRNLLLLFIHCTVLVRTLQNPTSAVFTIMLHVHVAKSFCRSLTFLWCTLHNLSFAGFELQLRQTGMAFPFQYTFLTSKSVYKKKMGGNRLLLWQHCCHANQSFAS